MRNTRYLVEKGVVIPSSTSFDLSAHHFRVFVHVTATLFLL